MSWCDLFIQSEIGTDKSVHADSQKELRKLLTLSGGGGGVLFFFLFFVLFCLKLSLCTLVDSSLGTADVIRRQGRKWLGPSCTYNLHYTVVVVVVVVGEAAAAAAKSQSNTQNSHSRSLDRILKAICFYLFDC